MLTNYIKIALRNIFREWSYSLINILGLGIGLAASLVILTFVISELSYDKKFADSDRIYRVGVGFANLGSFARGPEVLAPTIAEELPIIDGVTTLRRYSKRAVKVNEIEYEAQLSYEVDTNFFQLFSYPFIEGSPEKAIIEESSIVISKSLAETYFKNERALGRLISLGDNKTAYQVSGVVDNSGKSHMKANIWLKYLPTGSTHWSSADIYTFVKLKEGEGIKDLEVGLASIIEHKVYPEYEGDLTFQEWNETDASFNIHAMKLTDIYFNSQLMFELSAGGNLQFIYIFSSIATFILLLASINFINLTTARSSRRGKEVGVRKSMGGSKTQLILQFLLESLIMSTSALIIGLAVYEGFVIVFENIMNIELVSFFGVGGQFLLAFGISSTIGLLAGLYPAVRLTQVSTTKVLVSNARGSDNGSSFGRNVLVVFQFTISITLIISTLLIVNQLDYLKTTDVGFQKENIVIIKNVYDLDVGKESLKKELDQHSAVVSSAFASRLPAGSSWWIQTYDAPKLTEAISIQTFYGDENYLNTLEIDLLTGNNFAGNASDTSKVIINEAAVKALELEEPLGSTLEANRPVTVVGVMADFNFESLTQAVAPVILQYDSDNRFALAFRIQEGDAADFIPFAEKIYARLYPDKSMNYEFLDERFNALLNKEDKLAEGIMSFAAIAILISCLGLLGLSAYSAERRSKEIGVRKVLGASVNQLIFMLTKSFTTPVVIAIVLAIPFAYIIMSKWRSSFVYQADFSISLFLGAGLLAILLTWLTVGYFALSASSQSPTKTLRDE